MTSTPVWHRSPLVSLSLSPLSIKQMVIQQQNNCKDITFLLLPPPPLLLLFDTFGSFLVEKTKKDGGVKGNTVRDNLIKVKTLFKLSTPHSFRLEYFFLQFVISFLFCLSAVIKCIDMDVDKFSLDFAVFFSSSAQDFFPFDRNSSFCLSSGEFHFFVSLQQKMDAQ